MRARILKLLQNCVAHSVTIMQQFLRAFSPHVFQVYESSDNTGAKTEISKSMPFEGDKITSSSGAIYVEVKSDAVVDNDSFTYQLSFSIGKI